MKNNLFITIDFPPHTGGVAKYISNICGRLPNDKMFVLADGKIDEFDKSQKYTIIRENFNPKWHKIFFKLLKIIKRKNIGILHCSHAIPLGYLAWMVYKIKKIPYVIYLHGLDLHLCQRNAWKRFWLKLILNNAKLIITNSNYTKGQLISFCRKYEKKTEVVYPGVVNQDPIKKSKNLPDYLKDKKIMLTVSRLVPRKGHDSVIKALALLKDKFPQLAYLIIGDGKYRGKLEFLAKQLQIEDKVFFLGYVSDDQLPLYYSISDIFIMPSREIKGDVEGFGIVYLEANSYAKPVIAGKSGGVSEAVKDGYSGLLVDPEDINDIANKIQILLSKPDLAKTIGVQGKMRVEQCFTWDKQSEYLIKLLEKI